MRYEKAQCLPRYTSFHQTKKAKPMTETSITICNQDDTVTIWTTSKSHAKSIKTRLEEADAKWEWSEYQNGDGSWKFEVDEEDVRHPKYVLMPN